MKSRIWHAQQKTAFTNSMYNEYFAAMEKYVHTAVPQLIADYLTEFREKLIVEFETYFNGERMHHADIAKAIAEIVEKSIDAAALKISVVF